MPQNTTDKKTLFNSGNSGDQSDSLANRDGQVIDIFHVPSGKSIQFKAYLTAFTDQYSSEWNSETVFGRMDPIQTFKNTSRVISLGWDVPAASFIEAKQNLLKASLLLSMLYPEYEEGSGGATTMSAPPMFKIKFVNLIQDSQAFGASFGKAQTSGLLGTIAGLTYEPDLEAGFFQPSENAPITNEDTTNEWDAAFSFQSGKKAPVGVAPADIGKLFPQTIKFQAEFTVLHQHKLGWKSGDPKRACGFGSFPYAIKTGDTPTPVNGAAIAATAPPEAVQQDQYGNWLRADGSIIVRSQPANQSAEERNSAAQELQLNSWNWGCK